MYRFTIIDNGFLFRVRADLPPIFVSSKTMAARIWMRMALEIPL